MTRIKRLSPHQNAKVAAILTFVMSLFFVVPMVLVMSSVSRDSGYGMGSTGAMMFIFMPILYLIIGYIMTAIMCLVYNLLAPYIGGFEFEAGD